MKKAAAAAGLLLVLFLLAGWNIHHLDRLTETITGHLERSRTCCRAGDTKAAREEALLALSQWEEAAPYVHIMIRHGEVDAASDAFYDLLSALDEGGSEHAYDRLEHHLRCIRDMEHVRWGTIF